MGPSLPHPQPFKRHLHPSPDIKGISHLSQGAWLGAQASPSFLHRPLEASWAPGGRDSS